MKKSILISGVLSTLVLLSSGCTPKMAGQDSAYINQNRGAAGAQISQAEAQQYRRQQALSANEMAVENMKRRQTTDSIREGANAASSVSDAIRDGVGAVKSLQNLIGW